jgi:hypothetical protein
MVNGPLGTTMGVPIQKNETLMKKLKFGIEFFVFLVFGMCQIGNGFLWFLVSGI